MELEDLKNCWKDMSERLDQKEILEKRLLKETITNRARSVVDKAQAQSYRTMVVTMLIAFGLLPFLCYKGIMTLTSVVVLDAFLLLAQGFTLYIRSYVTTIDLSKPVKDMSTRILRYKKLNKTNNFVQPVIALAIVISYYLINNASFAVYLLFLASLLIMAYPVYLQWKKHNADIEQLEGDIKALEEL